jgi:hypothetical protein
MTSGAFVRVNEVSEEEYVRGVTGVLEVDSKPAPLKGEGCGTPAMTHKTREFWWGTHKT